MRIQILTTSTQTETNRASVVSYVLNARATTKAFETGEDALALYPFQISAT